MMLPAQRVLGEEVVDRAVWTKRLDKLELRAVYPAVGGRIDETDCHPLFGEVEWFVDLGGAKSVAAMRDGVGDGGRCDADVIEAA
jgi:hypothetical protein